MRKSTGSHGWFSLEKTTWRCDKIQIFHNYCLLLVIFHTTKRQHLQLKKKVNLFVPSDIFRGPQNWSRIQVQNFKVTE